VTATPLVKSEDATGFLEVVAQRLRAAADAALTEPPATLEDPASDGDACLAAMVDRLVVTSDPALAWLVLTALAGAYPVAADVQFVIRACDLHGPAELTLALLDRAQQQAWARGVDRPARVVTDVVVDVDMSARIDMHNGIQRVVREVVGHWWGRRPVVLGAWTSTAGTLRTLAADEQQRVVEWGRHDGHGRPGDGPPPVRDDVTELLIPWRTTVVLAEVPLTDRCPQLAALAQYSGNEVGLIGYDAIPFVSADLRPFGEANAFAQYLTVVKHADRVAGISTSAVEEFAGFVDALGSQGVTGPVVTEVVQPVTVPAAPAGYVRAERDAPLIVYVGRLEPHKNHDTFLHAAERLWREGLRFDLRIVGGPGWTTDRVERQLSALHRLGASVTWMRGVGDDELWQLIRDASFTAFISLHEGFGLPVAESLACGTPVLTTAYGSQGEIASAGGCLTVDPRDDAAVTEGLRRMLTDQPMLARLREEASRRPVDTWGAYADGVWDALVQGGPA
jgi:glycosyltransferase involved in cell wall biosynthesis